MNEWMNVYLYTAHITYCLKAQSPQISHICGLYGRPPFWCANRLQNIITSSRPYIDRYSFQQSRSQRPRSFWSATGISISSAWRRAWRKRDLLPLGTKLSFQTLTNDLGTSGSSKSRQNKFTLKKKRVHAQDCRLNHCMCVIVYKYHSNYRQNFGQN